MRQGRNFVWIRRGYGAFVPCKNESKARAKASRWYSWNEGGSDHPVIGLFYGKTKSLAHAERVELYNENGPTGK